MSYSNKAGNIISNTTYNRLKEGWVKDGYKVVPGTEPKKKEQKKKEQNTKEDE